jgi:hypothetical protein
MRAAVLPLLLAAGLAVPAAVLAADGPKRAGTLSVDGAMGQVRVQARGGLLGRVESGSIQLVDLTPNDRWFPVVNGIGRGVLVTYRGESITFRLLGGSYRLVLKGRGISIAARGHGWALLDGEPNEIGDTGIWAVGPDADCRRAPEACAAVPEQARLVTFGSGNKLNPSLQP